jgi:hypothetical protein
MCVCVLEKGRKVKRPEQLSKTNEEAKSEEAKGHKVTKRAKPAFESCENTF